MMPLSSVYFFYMLLLRLPVSFFFFNDTATTEIYTLSLHDALPICIGRTPSTRRPFARSERVACDAGRRATRHSAAPQERPQDRKSTRLNSSHLVISYAVFCLKKKNNTKTKICALEPRHQLTACV